MKTRCLISAFVTTCALSISLGVYASSATVTTAKASKTAPYEALVAKLSHGQLIVTKVIPGVANLVGLVAQKKAGGPQIVLYADKQARYALYGSVFNPQGENLTETAMEKYVTPAIAQQALSDFDTLTAVQDGKTGPVLNVIIDPNCIWCNRLFKDLRPIIDQGLIQVRWFMVGIIKPDSLGKSAAILAAKNPLEALKKDELNFDEKSEEGSITPLTTIPKAIGENLNKTVKMMSKYGFNGTPVIVFKTAQGEAKYLSGYPRDIHGFLESSFGIKATTAPAKADKK